MTNGTAILGRPLFPLLAGFLAGFLVATGGCGGESRTSQEPCVPGATATCTCENGLTGAKICVGGESFTECQCVGPAGVAGTGPVAGSGGNPGPAGGGGAPPVAGTGGVGGQIEPQAGVGGEVPPPAGTGGAAGAAGIDPVAGAGGAAGSGQTLPPVTDYAARGPFTAQTINNTGPDGQYTMFRPTTLGENGFLHPPLTWGNGVTTTPAIYTDFLETIASHGFVVIASNSTAVNAAMLTAGLDWLLQLNNDPASEFYQKLDPNRAVTMGYSLGGGAALTAAAHPAVVTTIAMHPAPGGGAHAPVLLFTGSADTIVSPSMVDMSYNGLTVPTFYTNLAGATHMEPILTGGNERAPSIAWLRMWVYNDDGGRVYFYGTDCILCVAPWTCKTKNW